MDWQRAPGRLPDGVRVYAVGDVHGCATRLAALHGRILDDLAARPVARAVLVHLGDYVDKGGDPAAALDLVAGLRPQGIAVVNLMGNHERLMRDALAGDPAAVTDWLWCGGRETLASYGISADSPPRDWAGSVPAAHCALLRDGLALTHREGGYLFVHAGVRPGVPIADQAEDDLLTIRSSFLHWEGPHEAVVVHGHTARLAAEIRPNRVNLDTAAFCGGQLTCGVFEADRLALISS